MQSERERKFLDLLWQEQDARQLSDSALAKSLEVAHSTISRLKSGKRGLGTDLMFRAAQEFPSLRIFLAGELLTSTDSMNSSKEVVA